MSGRDCVGYTALGLPPKSRNGARTTAIPGTRFVLSYSHETPEHVAAVTELAGRLQVERPPRDIAARGLTA